MSAKAKPKMIPAAMFHKYEELDRIYRALESQRDRNEAAFRDMQQRLRRQGKVIGDHVFDLPADDLIRRPDGHLAVLTDDGVTVLDDGGLLAVGQVEGEDRWVDVSLYAHRPSGRLEFRISYDRTR